MVGLRLQEVTHFTPETGEEGSAITIRVTGFQEIRNDILRLRVGGIGQYTAQHVCEFDGTIARSSNTDQCIEVLNANHVLILVDLGKAVGGIGLFEGFRQHIEPVDVRGYVVEVLAAPRREARRGRNTA